MKSHKSVLVTAAIGLAAFILTFATTTIALAQSSLLPQPPASTQREAIAQQDFGSWRYKSYREGQDVTVAIEVTDTSLTGLEAFRDANRALVKGLSNQNEKIATTIVLNHPLSVEEFGNFVSKYGLEVVGYQMRIIDEQGGRITLFGSPDEQKLVSDAFVDSVVARVYEDTGDATALGVISMDVQLSPDSYDQIANDGQVFMVDVTPGFARLHLKSRYSAKLNSNDQFVSPSFPTYWYLEDNQ